MEFTGVSALRAAAPIELDPLQDPLLPLLQAWKGASITRTHLNISCPSQTILSGTIEWETLGIDGNVTLLDASYWLLSDVCNFMPGRPALALNVIKFIERCILLGIRTYAKCMYFSTYFSRVNETMRNLCIFPSHFALY